MTRSLSCPTCKSSNPKIAASNCYNAWHHGTDMHLQRESIGTSGAECHAACGATIDDPPSQLAIALEFVSCSACLDIAPACDRAHPAPSCVDPTCYREEAARKADGILPGLGDLVRKGKLDPGMPDDNDKIRESAGSLWKDQATIIPPALPTGWRVGTLRPKPHRELSDDEIEQAPLEELRAAYRSLRDHHVAETTALIASRDDLRAERGRLSEIVDFMQNHYSPIVGRPCALCVREERSVRLCAMHRWEASQR